MLQGMSVTSTLAAAGLNVDGVVRWRDATLPNRPGVYLVALTDSPTRLDATLPTAPIGANAIDRLLGVCPELRLDGLRPTSQQLRERVGAFWLASETVLYAGKASALNERVNAFYTTRLGARSPHAGGWFLKTLANLDELFVHYSVTDSAEAAEVAERAALDAFMAGVPTSARDQLHDPTLPLPFANLRLPSERRKRHGIFGATGCV